MNDPYKVLGVSPDADDKEIKKAYKELVKKYHPDQYQDNPLADVAAEKMTQINAAFDQIMNERRGTGAGGGFSGGYGNSYASAYDSVKIRSLIQLGNITAAEKLLEEVNSIDRDAEWYFLMGSVFYRRGWLNEAFEYFQRAYQLNPGNPEYSAALNQMKRQQGGYMRGNPTANSANSDINNACNCCSDLICADCCCECMGGDLIPCC